MNKSDTLKILFFAGEIVIDGAISYGVYREAGPITGLAVLLLFTAIKDTRMMTDRKFLNYLQGTEPNQAQIA